MDSILTVLFEFITNKYVIGYFLAHAMIFWWALSHSAHVLKRDAVMEKKYAPFVRNDHKYLSWKYALLTFTFWPRFFIICGIIITECVYGGLIMIGHKSGDPLPYWKR